VRPSTKNKAPAASRQQILIGGLAVAAIVCHLVMRYGAGVESILFDQRLFDLPLLLALALGGGPLVMGLLAKLWRREFGSDLLAGASIVTSVLLHQYLAGTLVVLMLSGGEALEAYAVRSASSVLAALAKRMPSTAHRKREGHIADAPLDGVATAT
jgi:cation transport ATPase